MDAHSDNNGDFGRLFVQYETRIYGYIRSLVLNRTDAEDLLQETASVLWQKFGEFKPGTNFLAWAMSIARFQVQHFRRREKRAAVQFSQSFQELLAADMVEQASGFGDLQQFLEQCLRKLPQADRELFGLRYASDITTLSLAAQLGRPASTIYNAISRIRRTLADCIQREMNKEERR
jgi:RNA polymerase sigma-70 factor, ECF subfamily